MKLTEKLLDLLRTGPIDLNHIKNAGINPNSLSTALWILRKKGHKIVTELSQNRQQGATYRLISEAEEKPVPWCKGMAKEPPDQEYTCKKGDIVLYQGKRIVVAEVLEQGRPEKCERAFISGHRIDADGAVLRRTTLAVERAWSRPPE